MLILLQGCTSPRFVTAWTTEHLSPFNYSRILVVGILPDEDSSIRKKIEENFTKALNDIGYEAVSAISKFGLKGLANLGEATTYRTLNESGIDAVITIALVNKAKVSGEPANAHTYPNDYYYRRIWDYKTILTQPENRSNNNERYFWESLLFDLSNLEAICAIQTQPSDKATQLKTSEELAKPVVQKMIREKILKKQAGSGKPKAF
jgi:hypothetical protein